jgi:hypothetical protein
LTGYDDFIERLEAALYGGEGREDFLAYLQELTKDQRAELVAEADRREPEAEGEREMREGVSAMERTDDQPEEEPEQSEAERPAGKIPGGETPTPLFLRNGTEGRKGDAQDEKDEMGE